jgi:O-antigen ligase
VRWHVGFYPTTLLEAGIVVTVATFVVEWLRGPRELAWRTSFTAPAALLLLAGAIGVVVAPDPRSALGLYRAYLIEPIAFFLVVATIARTLERGLFIAAGLGVAGVLLAVPNALAVLDAIHRHSLHVESATPVAIYLTANAVALFLEPLIALGGSLLLFAEDNRQRLVSLAFLLIAIPTELLTFSRGGFLALAAICLGLALASSRRWWLLAASAAAALAVTRIPSIWSRIAVEVDFSNPSNTLVGRFQLWSAALRMLRDHPLFGAGLSGFASRLGPYWNATHADRFVDPHNILLNFWSETGILGVVAFAWLLITGLRVTWRGWRQQSGWRAIQLGVLLALVAVVVHGFVDVPYFKNDLSLEFWTLLGLAWAGHRAVSTASLQQDRP